MCEHTYAHIEYICTYIHICDTDRINVIYVIWLIEPHMHESLHV